MVWFRNRRRCVPGRRPSRAAPIGRPGRLEWAGGFLLAAGLVLAGCGAADVRAGAGGELLAAPSGTVSVFQLAERLGLFVTHASRCSATLRDERNRVTLFADPGGRVYLNGRVLDGQGIVSLRGLLFVPRALERDIRLGLRPRSTPPQPALRARTSRLRSVRVVIDPGHGGKDPGAVGLLRGRRGPVPCHEKAINLAVAKRIAAELRACGANVVMTRDDDTFVSLSERARIANRCRAALFVSIHANWAANRSAVGYEVYVSRGASGRSREAAMGICRQLAALGVPRHGTPRVRNANFRVLVLTSCPAVLVELGFLSNSAEAAELADAAYQGRLAGHIAQAIARFLEQ
jgi:N-acetylmuramoyl-L-alanine amidase